MSKGHAYDILGVSPQAGEEEIKRAFRRLARKYHPDVSSVSQDHERFLKVRRAYEELIDPVARAALDRRLRAEIYAARPKGWEQASIAAKDLADLLTNAVHGLGLSGPYFRDRQRAEEGRFEGHITGSRRFELDALLTRREALEGAVIPFRFELGPTLVEKRMRIPKGAHRGQTLRYDVLVAPGIHLEVLVHVDIA